MTCSGTRKPLALYHLSHITSIKALESKIEELEKGLAKAEKVRPRATKDDRLAPPLKVDTIKDFRDCTTGLTRWMLDILDMISNATEENILDDPPAPPASDVWSLVVKA